MSVSSKLIVANWKMNGSLSLVHECLPFWQKLEITHSVVLCPPFTLLSAAKNILDSSKISLGAQDCHTQSSGAFTGEISTLHLQEVGCRYVIVGHSERRQYHAESNTLVKAKAEAALSQKLIPIICIGESLEEREKGETLAVLKKQVEESIPSLALGFCLAYEPIWAIGTGKIPSLENIKEVHAALRQQVGNKISLLYGGSVTATNYQEILELENVDGLLIGGASLKKEDFGKIITNAA